MPAGGDGLHAEPDGYAKVLRGMGLGLLTCLAMAEEGAASTQ